MTNDLLSFFVLAAVQLTWMPTQLWASDTHDSPNVILILADDLGYGDVGCYGSTINRTPHIDGLGAAGLRFTDFHSAGPMCGP